MRRVLGALVFSIVVPSIALAQSLPRVYVLATGGTIAGRGATTTSGSNYTRAAVAGADLVSSVPELTSAADIPVEQIASVYGNDLTIRTGSASGVSPHRAESEPHWRRTRH